MDELPFVSIIIPSRNAVLHIKECLESIKNLDYPPHRLEVILADGLSQDSTREIAKAYSVEVVSNPKQTVGSGRNVGFVRSKGNYIAFTDADCILSSDYLKNALAYFKDENVAGVSGPIIAHPKSSPFENGVKVVYELAAILFGATQKEKIHEVREVKDISGCSSIYRREILEKVMPYDKSLLTGEDVDLNFRIRQMGYKLLVVPDVILIHYCRGQLHTFLLQMYCFAIGRLQVGKKNKAQLNAVHVIVGLSIPFIIVVLLVLCFVASPTFTFYMAVGMFALGVLIIFIIAFISTHSLKVSSSVVLAMVIAVSGWSLGFMRELLFPLQDARGK